MTTRRRFLVGFALVAITVAGILSYLASSQPDGLDAATLRGCERSDTGELTGTCIAQSETEHHMAASPLADYTIFGSSRTTGAAGVVGVVATFALAGGVFWLISRSRGQD